MLRDLVVEGLGVIERADLTFEPGSTALTGETGAGKTLLVAALGLLTGGRADRALVRAGSTEARVEGRWTLPEDHPAVALLREADLAGPILEDDVAEVVVARSVGADGRGGKARVNGRVAPVAILVELGRHLVEIAGQHEHQQLSRPAAQRTIVDSFAGIEAVELARIVAEEVRRAAETSRRLEETVGDERARERAMDQLRYELAEIDGAALVPGESERLQTEALRLENASALAEGIEEARDLIRGERGAADIVDRARAALARLADVDPTLGPSIARLESVLYELADLAEEIGARSVDPDPAVLEETRARLTLIRSLERKYGADETAVLGYREEAAGRLGELEGAAQRTELLEQELRAHTKNAEGAAERLSVLRSEAAVRLEGLVSELLGTLAMPGAELRIKLTPCELYEGGRETVELLVAANAGEAPRPVSKVASGGELSRIALALHLLTSPGSAPTMVFDEVDAGVGGEAAQSIGRALARLARSGAAQVLVVTHLPQVAAFADHQVAVSKVTVAGRAGARVTPVQGEERLEELSRMLAGMRDSDTARDHARELLDLAQAEMVGT